MKLLVIGVNHKTAPIALREQLAFSDAELPTAYQQLNQICDGGVIVSTCNRTEIYLLTPQHVNVEQPSPNLNLQAPHHSLSAFTQSIQQIKAWLAVFKALDLTTIEPYFYVHQDTEALSHWIRVSAGLDSMILGEPQILGQIKQAVNKSASNGGMSNKLSWITAQVFGAAKQVRHDTNVGAQAVTLGFATAKLATQIFDDLSDCTLLLVAAGEMNRLVANHLASLGVGRIIIANRNPERAIILAQDLAKISAGCLIETITLPELEEILPQADIVSSCSGSMDTLINVSMTKQAVKKRRYRSMLLVDLAVPRDIEEAVNTLDEVYLYSIDDLQHVISDNIEHRKQAAVDAELMVSQIVVEIEKRFQARLVGGDINAYREVATNRAQKLLDDALLQLKNGDGTAEEVMQQLTHKLTQTLTHAPSKLIREVASSGDADTMSLVIDTLNEAYREK